MQLATEFPMAFGPESAWQDNMTMLRSLRPEFRSGARDNEFLVSIVDEAHALINPEHSEGRGPFGFELKLGPQAYHIIRSSIVSVFLLDPDQDFRDRENTTIADIKKWAQELDVDTFDKINLGGAQFRCAGSTEYVDWIDRFLSLTGDGSFYTGSNSTPVDAGNGPIKIDRFRPFEIELFSNPFDLEESLRERVHQGYTARLAATYSRKWKTEKAALPHLLPPEQMDFYEHVEDDNGLRYWSRIWNYIPQGNDYTHFIQAPLGSKMSADCLCEVGCPYAIRGFDFDYIGLLWLGDLKWRHDRWIVDPTQVFDTGMRRRRSAAQAEADLNGPAHAALSRSVRKAYRILLTRMMKGIFVWCEDVETRNHLRLQLETDAGLGQPPERQGKGVKVGLH